MTPKPLQPALASPEMSETESVGQSPGPASSKGLRIICVGTGWSSEKGGLSTFNRYLALGLKGAGHEVTCVVDTYDPAEFDAAAAGGVTLSTLDRAVSSQNPPVDLVIGHGRITGETAVKIAGIHNCRRIHFIHTRTEAISHIRSDFPKSMEKGDANRKFEVDLCDSADLVAAVGPLLQRHMATVAHCNVHAFLPGLPTEFNSWEPARTPPLERHCLMLGRASDAVIKGFDIGAAAVSRVSPERGEPIAVIRGALNSDRIAINIIKSAMLSSARSSRFQSRPFTADENAVARDIRSAAVVLMPSREEGFGLVGLEAIAAGVPLLVSKRSGLAEFLEEINANHGTVIAVTDDSEESVNIWTAALARVLENLDSAFQSAEKLRLILEKKLSWTNSARGLLDALEAQAHAEKPPPATHSRYLEAALYLSGRLDVAAVNRSTDMIRRLCENAPSGHPRTNPEETSNSIANILLEQFANAHRSDNDVASQLEFALSALRLKYGQSGFIPAEHRAMIQTWRHDASRRKHDANSLEQLQRYLNLADMVAQDIAAIPRDVLAYGRRHGLSMNNAVSDGTAITYAGFGCPAVGETVFDYALENLERIFEAGANLIALNPRALGRGYLPSGKAASPDVAQEKIVVALALRESLDRSAISIMSQKRDEEGITEDASFVARAMPAEIMRFVGGQIGASSQDFLYRWGGTGPTPEMEWRVSPGDRIARWCAAPESGIWHVFIESGHGNGYAYHERNLVGTWKVPAVKLTWPGCAVMWSDREHSLLRAYSFDPGKLVLFRGLDAEAICASVDFHKDVAPKIFGLLRPHRLEVGSFMGRTCLAVFCILDPGTNAVFFLDALDFKALRPPLICHHYFEEVRLVEAGGHSFFMATLTSGSGSAFAVWDVTDGASGKDEPLAICCPSAAGGVLDCLQEEGGFSAWFTSRSLPHGAHLALWRWRYPSGACDKMLVLSNEYALALAVSSPLQKQN